jgi:hypothetical protein
MNRTMRVALAVAFLLTVVGCGGSSTVDDEPVTPVTPTTSTEFTGTLVGNGSTSGSVSLVFATTVAVTASAREPRAIVGSVGVTGTLRIGTVAIALSGTYDPGTHAFSVTGTGTPGTFVLTGTASATGITGTFTGPGGETGAVSGVRGATTSVAVYCGTFTSSSDSGAWNLVQSGNTLTGIAYDSPSNIPLSGTVSGTTLNVTFGISSNGLTATGTATGTFSGSSVSGTWSATLGGQVVDAGTFSGTRC